MYRDTITLFNRKSDRSGDTWYPSVLKGVDLNADRAAILARYGAECKDVAKLHVKYDGDRIGTKTYLEPKTWDALATVGDNITFHTGEEFDFFILGEWTGGVVSDTSYTDGFYNYMNQMRDDCYAISSCAKYSVIPHFEIMAR